MHPAVYTVTTYGQNNALARVMATAKHLTSEYLRADSCMGTSCYYHTWHWYCRCTWRGVQLRELCSAY